MQKVLFVVGPTGVGKTALAFEIAKKFDGNLISVDSVQVYKDLDIISGKDVPKSSKFTSLPGMLEKNFNTGFYTFKKTPIFLLDVVKPSYNFSVNDFYNLASKCIQYIGQQRKLAIVVGGTGLYVKSLIDGFDSNLTESDLGLRKDLEKLDVKNLQEKLKKVNFSKFQDMNVSDVNNKRRLVRAIEVSELGIHNKQSFAMHQELRIKDKKESNNLKSLVIGLLCEREVLKKRIDARVEERLKNDALKEAEGLFQNYQNFSPQVKNANGYKQLFQFLKKEISFEEAIYRWKVSEYRHAKNQMTWFRKYGDVKWFDVEKPEYKKEINKKIKEFLL